MAKKKEAPGPDREKVAVTLSKFTKLTLCENSQKALETCITLDMLMASPPLLNAVSVIVQKADAAANEIAALRRVKDDLQIKYDSYRQGVMESRRVELESNLPYYYGRPRFY